MPSAPSPPLDALDEARELVAEVWRDTHRWGENYPRAQALLEAALAKAPDDVEILTSLGAVLSDQGRHAEAVVVLERAEALGSRDRHTAWNLGVALQNRTPGDPRAMSFFHRAGEREPSARTLEAYFDPQGT